MPFIESEQNNEFFDKFIQKIRDRSQKLNQNWLSCICGGTGTAKTFSAIALAILISKNGFDVDRNICFTPKEFMEKVQKLKSGDVIIFEEAGVGMSSKEWFTIQNKMLSYVLQTFRHRNISVIFTMPGLKLIDGTARILFHTYFETEKIWRTQELSQLKVLNFEYNSLRDKTYNKYPCFYNEHGNLVTMKSIMLRKPPQDIIDRYEQRKTEYTENLNKEIMAELQEIEFKKDEKQNVCPVCKSFYYQYLRTKKIWSCKKCGAETDKNPYVREE